MREKQRHYCAAAFHTQFSMQIRLLYFHGYYHAFQRNLEKKKQILSIVRHLSRTLLNLDLLAQTMYLDFLQALFSDVRNFTNAQSLAMSKFMNTPDVKQFDRILNRSYIIYYFLFCTDSNSILTIPSFSLVRMYRFINKTVKCSQVGRAWVRIPHLTLFLQEHTNVLLYVSYVELGNLIHT